MSGAHDIAGGMTGRGPARATVPGMSLACRRLCFTYAEARSAIPALRDVDFELTAGSSLALLGASGSGKSTLLQVIKGLDAPESGAVLLDGVGPDGRGRGHAGEGEAAYAGLQRQVGLVFQTPELQLFASSAREDVAFGPRRLGWSEEEVAAAVDEALEMVALPPVRFGERHPYALSGGEQRRLALAGVLAMRPRLLLLDEPFVSLDPATRRELAAVLVRLREAGVTLVLATHDVDLAWALCDGLLLLEAGRVVAAGEWTFGVEEAAGLLGVERLREPFLVRLWRRLGRDPREAPRTYAEAAEELA